MRSYLSNCLIGLQMNDLSFAFVLESFLDIPDNSLAYSLTLPVRFLKFSFIQFINYFKFYLILIITIIFIYPFRYYHYNYYDR